MEMDNSIKICPISNTYKNRRKIIGIGWSQISIKKTRKKVKFKLKSMAFKGSFINFFNVGWR